MFSIPRTGGRNKPLTASQQHEKRLELLATVKHRIQNQVQSTADMAHRAAIFADPSGAFEMEGEAWADLARVVRGCGFKGEVYVRMGQACDRMWQMFAALSYTAKVSDSRPHPTQAPFLDAALRDLNCAVAAEIGTIAGLLRPEYWSQGL